MAKYYIDQEALFQALTDKFKARLGSSHLPTWNDAFDTAKSIPAADVVEVVRCENCAEWQRGWSPITTQKGVHFCAITGLFTEPDWFCKDGNISEVEEDNG